EQAPVRLERALRDVGELRGERRRCLGQRLTSLARMLDVTHGVQAEVLRCRVVSVETVVVDQAGQLRLRDRRLRRLDRVKDGERTEALSGRPGSSTSG